MTVDSNIDMKDRYRILNLKHPVDADEPATKQYADSTFLDRDGSQTMIGNLSMNNNRIIKLATPSTNDDAATKKYVDDSKVDGSVFLKLDGTKKMTGNLDMNNNRIYNLLAPTGPKQPTPLAFTDLKYLHVTGTNSMSNNLNMNSKSIIHLKDPTNITDGASKRYVDNTLLLNNIAMSNYLKKDGTVTMTGNLNLGNKKDS